MSVQNVSENHSLVPRSLPQGEAWYIHTGYTRLQKHLGFSFAIPGQAGDHYRHYSNRTVDPI